MVLEKKENSSIIAISIVLLFIGIIMLPITTSISSAQFTQNQPPTVSIIKPEGKRFYIHDFRLFPALRTRIFGFITIKANATDDMGIKQVEFYIDGELRNISTKVHGCGSYMWIWNERTWIQSKHIIKVIAVDADGLTAEASREVTQHNFLLFHPFYP